MKRGVLVLVATAFLVATLVVAGCSGDDDDNGGSTAGTAATATTAPPAAATAAPTATTATQAAPPAATATTGAAGGGATTMNLVDLGYSPASLTGRVGQEVTLNVRNTGALPHTFTIDGVVDSGSLAAGGGATVRFTPSQAGPLVFYCTIHGLGAMSGAMIVSQ